MDKSVHYIEIEVIDLSGLKIQDQLFIYNNFKMYKIGKNNIYSNVYSVCSSDKDKAINRVLRHVFTDMGKVFIPKVWYKNGFKKGVIYNCKGDALCTVNVWSNTFDNSTIFSGIIDHKVGRFHMELLGNKIRMLS